MYLHGGVLGNSCHQISCVRSTAAGLYYAVFPPRGVLISRLSAGDHLTNCQSPTAMVLYHLLSIALALLLLALPLLLQMELRRDPAAKKLLQSLRCRCCGLALGLVVFLWSAYEGAKMLPDNWTPLVWSAVPIALAAGYYALDFTAVRAFGGLLVLTTNHLIQHAFAFHCNCRPLFAVVALVIGLAGMALIAWPWLMREGIEHLAAHPRRIKWLWIVGGIFAAVIALLPIPI